MGRSAGPGVPIVFRCSACRSTLRNIYGNSGEGYRVRLTGREKPYNIRGLGVGRNAHIQREYECLDCGHVGWSNHVGLLP